MARILLTHSPDTRENYYGPRALAGLRALGEVKLNETDTPLEGQALIDAARDCDLIVSYRQSPAPAELFASLPKLVAFLRCAIDIRNVDVAAASRAGVLVTQASAGFVASVSELVFAMMIDLARGVTQAASRYHAGEVPQAADGTGARGRHARRDRLRRHRPARGGTGPCLRDARARDRPLREGRRGRRRAGAARSAAGRNRFRRAARGGNRRDREPDQRRSVRQDETRRVPGERFARQPRRRAGARARARLRATRRRRARRRPRSRPDADAAAGRAARRDRHAAHRRPDAAGDRTSVDGDRRAGGARFSRGVRRAARSTPNTGAERSC